MQTRLDVMGMSCSHCEKSVRDTVLDIVGVSDVQVDLKGRTVTVTHEDGVTVEMIKQKIEGQGFDVV